MKGQLMIKYMNAGVQYALNMAPNNVAKTLGEKLLYLEKNSRRVGGYDNRYYSARHFLTNAVDSFSTGGLTVADLKDFIHNPTAYTLIHNWRLETDPDKIMDLVFPDLMKTGSFHIDFDVDHGIWQFDYDVKLSPDKFDVSISVINSTSAKPTDRYTQDRFDTMPLFKFKDLVVSRFEKSRFTIFTRNQWNLEQITETEVTKQTMRYIQEQLREFDFKRVEVGE